MKTTCPDGLGWQPDLHAVSDQTFIGARIKPCARHPGRGRVLQLLACAVLATTVSCTPGPRRLSTLSGMNDESREKATNYVRAYIDSPEMFPRERLRAERRQDLLLSWAMDKAMQDGKIRVRIISPPLQLTGDPNVDLARTYNVLLVADDLEPQDHFTNMYEIRVGPNPQLATVRPAEASDSLGEADRFLAEEQLTRLRLDQQTLRAQATFASNALPRLSNYWSQATAETTKLVGEAEARRQGMTNELGIARTNYNNASNEVAIAARDLGNPSTDQQRKTLADAINKQTQASTSLGKLKSDIGTVESVRDSLVKAEDARRIERDAVNRNNAVAAPAAEALEGLIKHWGLILTARAQLDPYTTNSFEYPMRSAMLVSFRGQALSQLQQVTIDVIRRAPVPATRRASSPVQPDANALDTSLRGIDEQLSGLNGLLLAEDRALEAQSRQAHLKIRLDKLQAGLGDLDARIWLFTNGLASAAVFASNRTAGGDVPPSYAGSGLFDRSVFMSSLVALSGPEDDETSDLHSLQGRLSEQLGRLAAAQSNLVRLQAGTVAVLKGVTNRVDDAQSRQSNVTHQLADSSNYLARAVPALKLVLPLMTNLPPSKTNLLDDLEKAQQGLEPAVQHQASLEKLWPRLQVALSKANQQVRDSSATNEALAAVTREFSTMSNELAGLTTNLTALRQALVIVDHALKPVVGPWPKAGSESASPAKGLKKLDEELSKALGDTRNDLSNLVDSLQSAKLTGPRRRDAATKVSALKGSLARAETLLQARSSLVVGPPASAPTPVNDSGNDVVARILRGDQAVFRLNVVRGWVSTTTFLLAEDAAASLFGQGFSDHFYAAQVTFRNPNDKSILIYGNTMRLIVRMNAVVPTALEETGELKRTVFWATWEPLDYDALRRVMESMQEKTWQRVASKAIDLASIGLGFYGVAADPSKDVLRFIAAFGGAAPPVKTLLEADLKRYAANFRDKGLNNIEEIPSYGTLTRYVFLPKGPIYGTFGFDVAAANDLPFAASGGRWNPFRAADSRDFGKKALQAAYIHDIRREEVYIEGKRILSSDPLTSSGVR